MEWWNFGSIFVGALFVTMGCFTGSAATNHVGSIAPPASQVIFTCLDFGPGRPVHRNLWPLPKIPAFRLRMQNTTIESMCSSLMVIPVAAAIRRTKAPNRQHEANELAKDYPLSIRWGEGRVKGPFGIWLLELFWDLPRKLSGLGLELPPAGLPQTHVGSHRY
jgi:hypothetical protein